MRLKTTIRPELWHTVGAGGEIAFLNSFANAGAGSDPLRFMKDPFGFVHIQGYIIAPGGAIGVCLLPIGYRPATQMNYAAAYAGATYALGNSGIGTNGALTVSDNAGAAPALNLKFFLDGLTYRADMP